MKIEITESTRITFCVELFCNEGEAIAEFDQLKDARKYAKWCNNNGYPVKKITLQLES